MLEAVPHRSDLIFALKKEIQELRKERQVLRAWLEEHTGPAAHEELISRYARARIAGYGLDPD